jgi:hypothetical protein
VAAAGLVDQALLEGAQVVQRDFAQQVNFERTVVGGSAGAEHDDPAGFWDVEVG